MDSAACLCGGFHPFRDAGQLCGGTGGKHERSDRPAALLETTGCGAYIAQEVHSETRYAKYKPLFETDGNYDETKTIDILNPDQKEGKKNKDTTFETGVLQEMLDDGVLDELSYVLEVPEDFFGSAQEYYEEYHGETASENADRTDASLMDVTKGNLPLSGVSLEQQIRERGNEGEAYGLQVFQGLSEVLSDLQVYQEGRNVNLDSNIKVFARNTEDGTVFTNVKAWKTGKRCRSRNRRPVRRCCPTPERTGRSHITAVRIIGHARNCSVISAIPRYWETMKKY